MESYPTEFTYHCSPLLFVAGLNPPPAPRDGSPAPGPGTPPRPPSTTANPTDPFDILTQALRKTFASRRTFQLWDSSRGHSHDFHTVLVDKALRFPPLKARPTSSTSPAPAQPPAALHSPISPLTPTSPLHPDGIIAPIWIRKHRELVPSVFILVLRLFELPPTRGEAFDPVERDDEERQQDALLIREIVDRKRSTLERGIKLAVVLLCSRELLDDPSLDLRLSLIRRQSGLDSRASLFVISPVPQSEVTNFVASIREELWPAAVDYYREHGRRVRRKRARQPPKGGLSERGWNVRYDYKLALFAEMRGEVEVALKHYEDCYESLVDMFAQPNLLVSRTKRWAEAKVLADCLTVKIAKIYLYLNDPSRSLSQLNRHIFRFRQLSESWEIGEQTFEFWSWLSKQYRLFGDLTNAALRAGFRLPSLRPPPSPLPTPGVPQPPSPGLLPFNVLQHPGHYYFLSAVCALERRERYRAIKDAYDKGEDGVAGRPPTGAMMHEGKVDHTELAIELYTKSYEHFKLHGRRRMTYSLASLIATAHASSEPRNADLALKFWDRIGKHYRKDGWGEIVDGMGEAVFEVAKAGGNWVEAIRAGWDLIGSHSTVPVDRRTQYAQEVLSILTTHPPPSNELARIHLEPGLSPILLPRMTFYRSTTTISTPMPFQLSLTSPSTSRIAGFTFDSLQLFFDDDRPPVVITHRSEAETEEPLADVTRYLIGDVREDVERTADLRWREGTTKVFVGLVSSDQAMSLSVNKVVLELSLGGWTITSELALDAATTSASWYLEGGQAVSLGHRTPSICSVMPRELALSSNVKHAAPSYLGERYPIEIDITNDDEIDVEVSFVAFLQPGDEGAHAQVSIDEHTSSSILDSIPLGQLQPKQTMQKTVFLRALGRAGDRQLEFTIRASPVVSSAEDASKPVSSESTHSLSVPCFPPFLVDFKTHFFPKRRPLPKLLDFETEPDGWEGAGQASVSAQVRSRGPWNVEILEIKVEQPDSADARVTSSSLDDFQSELPLSFTPADALGAVFALDVKPLAAAIQSRSIAPSLSITWQRSGQTGFPTTTLLPFPSLRPTTLEPRITLRIPPALKVHTATTLEYCLSNPTPHLLHLATQIDSAPQPSSFVFAGPRKTPSLVLAPGEERTVEVRVVPLVAGHLAIPRFRVFQVDPAGPDSVPPLEAPSSVRTSVDGRQTPVPPPPRMKELSVEVETERLREPGEPRSERDEVDGFTGLESELRNARGEGTASSQVSPPKPRETRVLVLP
ncbi:hypothetical protein JCM10212_001500 [Sporobolomyces blumeae]